MMSFLVFVLLFFLETTALKLPDFIKPCNVSDPKINECILKNARAAIPLLLPGIKTHLVPNFLPLRVPELIMNTGNLEIIFHDFDVIGLDTIHLNEAICDIKNKHLILRSNSSYIAVKANYSMNGRLLVMPIRGEGIALTEFYNSTHENDLKFNIYKKNGEEYTKIIEHELTYRPNRVKYNFGNLFGNKALSDRTNMVLNDNWDVVNKELGKEVVRGVQMIITGIANNFLAQIPYKYLYVE